MIFSLCMCSQSGQNPSPDEFSEIIEKLEIVIENVEVKNNVGKFTPKDGNYFLAVLLTITNTNDLLINGGGSGSHAFKLISQDGYILPAVNTSPSIWHPHILGWRADEIPPNETMKGWILFEIPNDIKAKAIVFEVDEITAPLKLRAIGKAVIEIPI